MDICSHFSAGQYLGVELLGHMVNIYLILLKIVKPFYKVVYHFAFLFQNLIMLIDRLIDYLGNKVYWYD